MDTMHASKSSDTLTEKSFFVKSTPRTNGKTPVSAILQVCGSARDPDLKSQLPASCQIASREGEEYMQFISFGRTNVRCQCLLK